MNIITRTVLEIKLGDRFYKFECSPDSPLHEINQALVSMNAYVVSRIEEAQKNHEMVPEKVEIE